VQRNSAHDFAGGGHAQLGWATFAASAPTFAAQLQRHDAQVEGHANSSVHSVWRRPLKNQKQQIAAGQGRQSAHQQQPW
jgi:hypothetical protein